jgi:hypothetical protein
LTASKVGAAKPTLTAWAVISRGWGSRSVTTADEVTVASSWSVAVTVAVGGEGTVTGAV